MPMRVRRMGCAAVPHGLRCGSGERDGPGRALGGAPLLGCKSVVVKTPGPGYRVGRTRRTSAAPAAPSRCSTG